MEHKISILIDKNKQLSVQEFKNKRLNVNNAVGIILQTEVIGLLISLDRFEEQWGEADKLITSKKGDSQNLMDISGATLTQQIVDFQLKNNMAEMSAAKKCWEYHSNTESGTDTLQWYLPSAYELCTLCALKQEVHDAMVSIGVTDENMLNFDSWFWSSSEHSSYNAMYVNFDSGYLNDYGKDNYGYVRAVSAFSPLESFNTLSCEFGEQGIFDLSYISDQELVAEMQRRGFAGEVTKTFTL